MKSVAMPRPDVALDLDPSEALPASRSPFPDLSWYDLIPTRTVASTCRTCVLTVVDPNPHNGVSGDARNSSIATNGATAESYGHDALGRRVYIAQGSTTNWMVYDGVQVIADVNSTGGLVRSYLWGPGIDNLLAFTTGYGTATTNTYFALTDHLGTVHALADSSGNVVEAYRFDAFGRVLGVYDEDGQAISESAVGNRFLWAGKEYSWVTGLYHNRARYYDPVTGRFISKDPIGITGGLNEYTYCNGDPVNMVDRDGLHAYLIRIGSQVAGHRLLAVDNPSGGMMAYHFYARGHHAGASLWSYARAFVYDRPDMWDERIPDPGAYIRYNLQAGNEIAIEAVALGTSADDAQMLYEMNEECSTENQSGYYSIFGGRDCNAMAWQWFRRYAGYGNTVDLGGMRLPSNSPVNLIQLPGFAWTTPAYDRASMPSFK